MIQRKGPIENLVMDGGYASIFRTIGVIGDSLASGEHVSYTKDKGMGWNDYNEYSWGQFMGRKIGSKVYNFSCGGLMAKTFFTEYIKNADPKVFSKEKACQAYIIALGVNDLFRINEYSQGFGSICDIDFNNPENNKDSYCGWYGKIVQSIKKLEPKARVFLMTTPYETFTNDSRRADIKDFLLKLQKCFEFTYVINLYDNLTFDQEYVDKQYIDGHLTAMGYKDVADIIMTYIDYIIRSNQEDFLQVAFIGKDVYNEKYRW